MSDRRFASAPSVAENVIVLSALLIDKSGTGKLAFVTGTALIDPCGIEYDLANPTSIPWVDNANREMLLLAGMVAKTRRPSTGFAVHLEVI